MVLLAAILALVSLCWADAPVSEGVTIAVTSAPTPTPPAAEPNPPGASAQYRVGAGDTLQVQVYGEPGLSGSFPVDDTGSLDFPLLGAVQVQGRNAAEVAALLHERLTPGYLVNPHVTVWLGGYRSQPVQVLGAVAKPGTYFLRGPTTVLQILSEAGGVSQGGVNEVRITHGALGNATIVPYEELLRDTAGGVELSAGDIVFVPQSVVSVMGHVGKPGELVFREGLTLSTAIAAAGGVLPSADLGRVYILRGDKRIRFSLRKILSGKAEDILVLPGDRIFVRESIV